MLSIKHNRIISIRNLIVLGATILLTVILSPPDALSMSVPPLSAREEGSMITYYKEGGKRWEGNWTMEEFEEGGVKKYRITMNARGLTSPFARDVKWQTVSVWKADSSFTPVQAETEIKDMNGRPVVTEKTTFNPANSTVTFVRKDYDGDRSIDKQFDITSDLLIVDGIVIALRSLPFNTGESVKTQFLTNEPELYNVEFKQAGIEKVETPQGEIECYKVELVPKLGVLNVFKAFFPKTYFWFTVAPPHSWVKYEGFENGRDTPEVVMEVTNFKQSGK